MPAAVSRPTRSFEHGSRRVLRTLMGASCVVAMALSAASCAFPSSQSQSSSQSHAQSQLPSLDGAWRVMSSASGATQTIVFDSGRAQGDGGCNRWSAEVLANDDGDLRFGPIASTRRGCLDDDANRREAAFLTMLREVRGYRDAGAGVVELIGAGGNVIGTIRR